MNTVYAYLRALLWHVEKLKTQGIQMRKPFTIQYNTIQYNTTTTMNTVYAYLRALLWHVEKLKTQGIQMRKPFTIQPLGRQRRKLNSQAGLKGIT